MLAAVVVNLEAGLEEFISVHSPVFSWKGHIVI